MWKETFNLLGDFNINTLSNNTVDQWFKKKCNLWCPADDHHTYTIYVTSKILIA